MEDQTDLLGLETQRGTFSLITFRIFLLYMSRSSIIVPTYGEEKQPGMSNAFIKSSLCIQLKHQYQQYHYGALP